MTYARKTTFHVPHYNHIVLHNFQPAFPDKDGTNDSSILIAAQAQLQPKPLFLTSPKYKISPLKLHQYLEYTAVLPCAFYHPGLLSNQTHNWELNLIYKWFMLKGRTITYIDVVKKKWGKCFLLEVTSAVRCKKTHEVTAFQNTGCCRIFRTCLHLKLVLDSLHS